jgi:hypothetical protein
LRIDIFSCKKEVLLCYSAISETRSFGFVQDGIFAPRNLVMAAPRFLAPLEMTNWTQKREPMVSALSNVKTKNALGGDSEIRIHRQSEGIEQFKSACACHIIAVHCAHYMKNARRVKQTEGCHFERQFVLREMTSQRVIRDCR